jgi:hypothetical protein
MAFLGTTAHSQTVTCKLKKPPHGQAHLFFANAKSQRTKK